MKQPTKKFLKYKKELMDKARSMGVKVRFVKIKSHDVSGYYHPVKKLIRISVGPKAPDASVLYVFAHEIRHAEHHRDGIFADYYRLDHNPNLIKFNKNGKLPRGYIPPNQNIGIRAEMNCDKHSIKFLHDRGYNFSRDKYPYWAVMGFSAYSVYLRKKHKIAKRSATNKGTSEGSQETWSQSDILQSPTVAFRVLHRG